MISANTYVLELLEDWNVSPTFNVEDLILYLYHGHYVDESYEEQVMRLPPMQKIREEIEDVLGNQIVFTRSGGY